MNKKLTDLQKQQYLRNPNECPYCMSENISSGDFEHETNSIVIECRSCKSEWIECFNLIDIEEKNNE